MAVEIKLFQSVRKLYQTIGLDPFQSNPTPPNKCDHRIYFIAFSIMQMFISSTAFLAFKAETIQDFATSFYASITQLYMLVNFFSLVIQMGAISKLTEISEKFIEKSK